LQLFNRITDIGMWISFYYSNYEKENIDEVYDIFSANKLSCIDDPVDYLSIFITNIKKKMVNLGIPIQKNSLERN
jgi:hypothetical protein